MLRVCIIKLSKLMQKKGYLLACQKCTQTQGDGSCTDTGGRFLSVDGFEYFTCTTSYGIIEGINITIGYTAFIWPEGHYERTYSKVYSLNWLPEAVKDILKSDTENQLSALSAGQITAINDYLN